MTVISDTSVISNFFLIERLDLLELLFNKIIIPGKVEEELLHLQDFGHDISWLTQTRWLEIQRLSDPSLVISLLQFLDEGEAEAILLAQELSASLLLADDLAGRNHARRVGVPIMGSIGIILKAKELGYIALARPLLDALISKAKARVAPKLYTDALTLAGE